MTEKIAAQLQETYNNKGRTPKHLIPQGRIPDLGWNTDQQVRKGKSYQYNPRSPCTPTTPQQLRDHQAVGFAPNQNYNIMDPQNRNAKMSDQYNALPQVNQVHTVRKAGFGWQTVVALTIIVNLI